MGPAVDSHPNWRRRIPVLLKPAKIVVIFVSSDRDQAGFDEYYGEMPWLALPFNQQIVKEKLSIKFGVQGIPMLIVLDGQGQVVTQNGRQEYPKFLSGGAAK